MRDILFEAQLLLETPDAIPASFRYATFDTLLFTV